LALIRAEGNDKHNILVLMKKEGTLIMSKYSEPTDRTGNVKNIACVRCKKYFKGPDFYLQRCPKYVKVKGEEEGYKRKPALALQSKVWHI